MVKQGICLKNPSPWVGISCTDRQLCCKNDTKEASGHDKSIIYLDAVTEPYSLKSHIYLKTSADVRQSEKDFLALCSCILQPLWGTPKHTHKPKYDIRNRFSVCFTPYHTCHFIQPESSITAGPGAGAPSAGAAAIAGPAVGVALIGPAAKAGPSA